MNYQSPELHLAADEFQNTGFFKSRSLRRWLVFLLIFIPCLLGSQIYIFLQPPIYQSTATVLTMAATDIDQVSPAADVQHVSIQKQILLGSTILEKTMERLQQVSDLSKSFTVEELRGLFSVETEPETNLVHLNAQGPEPNVLQLSVNAWIESYLQIRAAFIADNAEKVVVEIHDQLKRVDRQVMDKRNEIDQFRLKHDITSTESADNQAHARLQGLNASLNKALEQEVLAKAKFDAILDAISRNETVVPEEDSRAMAVLVEQAEKLRDQMTSIEAQYTKEYIDLNPNLRRVREQLADVETKIAEKATVGKNYARQEAAHNYAAAREAVIAIKQQMEAHKKKAAEYTTQFAEHEALQQELLNLETLQQETKQRLADIEVKQRQKYPQVDVVEWATLPDKPISPDYLQQSLLAFTISLGLALLAVWIVDYLTRDNLPSASSIALGGIHLHHQPQAMFDVSPRQSQIEHAPLTALPKEEVRRTLSQQEVTALYEASEPPIKLIIGLLLNGLSLSEILMLQPDSFEKESLMVLVPGRRNVVMTHRIAVLISDESLQMNWPAEDEIEALLCCAAIDGGLHEPMQINAGCLRYTYMVYLVRQGIKLADLTKIVGVLPPDVLVELGRFSPEQAGLPLEKIKLDYF
ncbi:GumC family protein [Methylomonas sp. MgM2]